MRPSANQAAFASTDVASRPRGPRARGRPPLDARIRARFRDGDPDAVRAVYREYGRLVYAVVHRVLGDRGHCEDATQQTFLNAWRAAAGVDPARELGPWLATIARRVAIDVYRREALRAARRLDEVALENPAVASRPAGADALYDVWEVRRAVCELPNQEREIVRLHHFDGLTHAQIADRLGMPIGTAKSRSYRAHRRLAAALGHLTETTN